MHKYQNAITVSNAICFQSQNNNTGHVFKYKRNQRIYASLLEHHSPKRAEKISFFITSKLGVLPDELGIYSRKVIQVLKNVRI
ncbi:CLUMA_CG008873, isoform A [Clunio marinus]|uniref:CLUMA_CG008873, isoform A n=1 Tax=Clunio marinus TaxID=568069 RepID=A0A1J1I4W9_9DIPT|nr:CLUMA_CG008873, isoform A [Clunio marinus]